jgi:hypothetical protein
LQGLFFKEDLVNVLKTCRKTIDLEINKSICVVVSTQLPERKEGRKRLRNLLSFDPYHKAFFKVPKENRESYMIDIKLPPKKTLILSSEFSFHSQKYSAIQLC